MTAVYKAMEGDVLTRHLANSTILRADDKSALAAIAAAPARSINARRDLIREGEAPNGVVLILSGWACRYKMLKDGRRQIVSFLIPGDLCERHNTILAKMDHSIGAITGLRYTVIANAHLDSISIESPGVGKALAWQALVNVATQREWTLNIGQRNAHQRIGSLMCELFFRMRAIGMALGSTIDFPLRQIDIAEATGLTPVHVNRIIKQMRTQGLIDWSGKSLTIPDLSKLAHASLFTPDYLHLGDGEPHSERAGANL